jgi:hypothetical protein
LRTLTGKVRETKGGPEARGGSGSCRLAAASGTFPRRPPQNRTYDPGRLLSLDRAVSPGRGPHALRTAARGNGRLEAFAKVLAYAAVLLGLDDAVLVSRHAFLGNPEAGRSALYHLHLFRKSAFGTTGGEGKAGAYSMISSTTRFLSLVEAAWRMVRIA